MPQKIHGRIVIVVSLLLVLVFLAKMGQLRSNARLRSNIQEAKTCLREGSKFYAQGDYQRAKAEYERAVELCPEMETARDNVRLAMRMADPEAWLSTHPDDENLKHTVIMKYLEREQFGDAMTWVSKLNSVDERVSYSNDIVDLRMAADARARSNTNPSKDNPKIEKQDSDKQDKDKGNNQPSL